MNKQTREVISDFEKHAHPVDRVNYIMQKEILIVLKNILKELKNRDNYE